MRKFSNILNTLLLLAVCFLLAGCATDETDFVLSNANTGFRIALGNVSTNAVTRSTPSDLSGPNVSDFKLKITSNSRGKVIYDDAFTEDLIPASFGEYTIVASYGQNPTISIDEPYYIGSTTATVASKDEPTEVEVACHVGNALVSVKFGDSEIETARFNQLFSDYRVDVKVGDNSRSIGKQNLAQSVYFQAGSSISLVFVGKYKPLNDKEVSYELSHKDIPTSFAAADHAIITLSLAPETASVLDISKVELVEATIEETIPLSWLPIPQATPEHQYDADGDLVGTNVTFSDCYPGMEWKAEVTDAANNVVRTITGIGTLKSDATDATWPYLPAGNYKATYYLIKDGQESKTGTRDFTVPAPTLNITLNGHTSYDLYLAGDVDGANELEGNKAYGLMASVNISKELLSNNRYSKTMSFTLGGESIASWIEPTIDAGDKTQEPRLDAYALSGVVTFAGTTVSNSKNLYLTGLPVAYCLPTQAGGWTGHGSVTWNDKDSNGTPRIRLGQNTTSQPQYIDNAHFGIPAGTWVTVDYDVIVHGATVATTFSLTVGSDNFFEFKSSSGVANSKDHPFRNGTSTKQLAASATSVRANNSYGSGQTKSWVYALGYKYGKAQ